MQKIQIIFLRLLLSVLYVSTLCISQVYGQQKAVNERDVVFYYQEMGLPNSDQPKILLISSHIYRMDDYSYFERNNSTGITSDHFRNILGNAFYSKSDQIIRNEFNEKSTLYANQLMTKSNVMNEWAYYDGTLAKGTGPELYQSVRSTTTFILNILQAIISQYRNKGYSVFQVPFDEYVAEKDRTTYSRIEKLSPLYVEEYYVGSLRNLTASYQQNKTSNKKSGESYDPDMYCFGQMAKVEKLIATAKESGDEEDWKKAINEYNLYMGGCSSSTGLLPESQAMKAEIDRHLQLKAIGAAFDQYTMFQIDYTGLDNKDGAVNNKQFQKIGFQYGNRSGKYFHWYLDFAYVIKSPSYETVYYNNNNGVLKTETTNRKGVMVGAGLGPTVGLFKDNVQLFSDAGLNLFIHGKDYPDQTTGSIFLNLTSGLIFKLGSVGLGATYSYQNNLSKDEPGDIVQQYSSQGSMYTPKVAINKPYKDWGSFGVRFVFNFVKR